MPDPLIAFGIVALVFLVAALTSSVVERAPISFPMIFLGLGFLLGEVGLGWIKVGLHDPTLETVATLSLSFVLFLDALNIRLEELRKDWIIPVLSLGPGTLLTMLLISIAAAILLHLSVIHAVLIGVVLSSVDPVLLRDVVRDERIPHSIRESLKTEAGANDIIVLPILLVMAAIAQEQAKTAASWLAFLGRLFLLGPLAGAVLGVGASFLIERIRARTPIRREYRALYGIGVLLAAYFAGTYLGSSGFLAVFAAGFATALLDYDLCDCFLEYGEITSEMLMLLAFLLFGALLSSLVGGLALLPVLLFAVVTIGIARPVAIGLVLRHAPVSRRARLFIGWFGPRGLSSLLFGLLLVSEGVPGSEQILALVGMVVIISVVLHGISAAPLAASYSQAVAQQTLPEEREGTATGLFHQDPTEVARITAEELADLLKSENPPVVLDVRSRSTYDRDDGQIPGSIRVLPDEVIDWAANQSKEHRIVTYCT
jgi:NhaP-type Na+/H+ or K+/H+ antiporter